jgi:hypothetical protein
MDYNVLFNCFGLLFLTIASNYSVELLSCDFKDTATNQVWIKHMLTYLLLLFFIVAIDKRAYEDAAREQWIFPKLFLTTFVVYLMFLVITKMRAVYAVTILVLSSLYMLTDIEKNGKELKNETEVVERLNRVQYGLIVAIALVASVGFVSYFVKQRGEYAGQFSYLKFIFGTRTCTRFEKQ